MQPGQVVKADVLMKHDPPQSSIFLPSPPRAVPKHRQPASGRGRSPHFYIPGPRTPGPTDFDFGTTVGEVSRAGQLTLSVELSLYNTIRGRAGRA